uniref:Peptidase M16 domain protein n=1 Tax=Cyanothece sp. (strain PCC 7425 / ATCC 29141) TaxID=395961 RepID=B8HKA8_CYAP4
MNRQKKIVPGGLSRLANVCRQRLPHSIALLLILLFSLSSANPALARETLPPRSSDTSIQPYLDRAIAQVTDFTLANGIKFIVLERHQAPVVSFLTYADVGGANEPEGQTGVAHYLEHLAFKGTRRIGTKDYSAEAPLLDRLDQLFAQIQAAQVGGQADRVQQLQTEFAQVESLAESYVIQNQMGQIVSQSGGVGLNANTSADATRYFYSFPSNKLELWMSLESERFLEPVFREFFKEKEVILEERRSRSENSPNGRLFEAFLAKAFSTHPYRRPVIGSTEDIRNLTRPNVDQFFATYYVPSNLTIAVVGDVNPQQVKQLAETYFGRYPAAPQPPALKAIEPAQTAPQEVALRLPAQPLYVEGYHIPAISDPDYVVYDLLSSLLSDGRTSRLYDALVIKQKVALAAQGFVGFPGNKYPNLILFYGLTAPGRSLDELATALHQEIERLKTEPVQLEELQRVKNQARVALLRSLDSNSGMAQLLLEYQVKTGDWRNLFKQLEAIAAITPADIQRVARTTFVETNRTIGKILPQPS